MKSSTYRNLTVAFLLSAAVLNVTPSYALSSDEETTRTSVSLPAWVEPSDEGKRRFTVSRNKVKTVATATDPLKERFKSAMKGASLFNFDVPYGVDSGAFALHLSRATIIADVISLANSEEVRKLFATEFASAQGRFVNHDGSIPSPDEFREFISSKYINKHGVLLDTPFLLSVARKYGFSLFIFEAENDSKSLSLSHAHFDPKAKSEKFVLLKGSHFSNLLTSDATPREVFAARLLEVGSKENVPLPAVQSLKAPILHPVKTGNSHSPLSKKQKKKLREAFRNILIQSIETQEPRTCLRVKEDFDRQHLSLLAALRKREAAKSNEEGGDGAPAAGFGTMVIRGDSTDSESSDGSASLVIKKEEDGGPSSSGFDTMVIKDDAGPSSSDSGVKDNNDDNETSEEKARIMYDVLSKTLSARLEMSIENLQKMLPQQLVFTTSVNGESRLRDVFAQLVKDNVLQGLKVKVAQIIEAATKIYVPVDQATAWLEESKFETLDGETQESILQTLEEGGDPKVLEKLLNDVRDLLFVLRSAYYEDANNSVAMKAEGLKAAPVKRGKRHQRRKLMKENGRMRSELFRPLDQEEPIAAQVVPTHSTQIADDFDALREQLSKERKEREARREERKKMPKENRSRLVRQESIAAFGTASKPDTLQGADVIPEGHARFVPQAYTSEGFEVVQFKDGYQLKSPSTGAARFWFHKDSLGDVKDKGYLVQPWSLKKGERFTMTVDVSDLEKGLELALVHKAYRQLAMTSILTNGSYTLTYVATEDMEVTPDIVCKTNAPAFKVTNIKVDIEDAPVDQKSPYFADGLTATEVDGDVSVQAPAGTSRLWLFDKGVPALTGRGHLIQPVDLKEGETLRVTLRIENLKGYMDFALVSDAYKQLGVQVIRQDGTYTLTYTAPQGGVKVTPDLVIKNNPGTFIVKDVKFQVEDKPSK